MMDKQPLVSICSTTYNREKYIGKAIESWLSQKVNFEYEIIISDDYSTDNTVKIIEGYISANNIKIVLLKSEQNQGLLRNSIKVYEAAKGKYIAHCDGDDYWIDDYKLQKQIDFLENNLEYVMCFTNSYIIDESTNQKSIAKVNLWDSCATETIIREHNSINAERYSEIATLGHMSSIVFRNYKIIKFPSWYYSAYNNDDPLFIMLSKFGKAKFINECCSVYRHNSEGVSKKDFSFEKDYVGRINFYKNLNKYFENKYDDLFGNLVAQYYYKLFKLYFKSARYYKSFITLCFVIVYDFKFFLLKFLKV